MKRSLAVSVALHGAIVCVAYFGLSFSQSPPPDVDPPALPVELVKVAEKANLPPPPPPPEPEAKKAERMPPPSPKIEPPKPVETKAKEAPPAPAPEQPRPPAAKPEAPLPKPTPPEPEVAEEKTEIKAQEPAEAPRDVIASRRPIPKPTPSADFGSVLKTVAELKQGDDAPEEPAEKPRDPQLFEQEIAEALAVRQNASTFDPSQAITMSELDVLRRQIERCWNVPAGAKGAEDLVVSIRVDMNPDGTPRSAEIVDRTKMRSSSYYEAAAESALRAVLNPRCHPFTLPRNKFEQWKSMTLIFNPKEFIGT